MKYWKKAKKYCSEWWCGRKLTISELLLREEIDGSTPIADYSIEMLVKNIKVTKGTKWTKVIPYGKELYDEVLKYFINLSEENRKLIEKYSYVENPDNTYLEEVLQSRKQNLTQAEKALLKDIVGGPMPSERRKQLLKEEMLKMLKIIKELIEKREQMIIIHKMIKTHFPEETKKIEGFEIHLGKEKESLEYLRGILEYFEENPNNERLKEHFKNIKYNEQILDNTDEYISVQIEVQRVFSQQPPSGTTRNRNGGSRKKSRNTKNKRQMKRKSSKAQKKSKKRRN